MPFLVRRSEFHFRAELGRAFGREDGKGHEVWKDSCVINEFGSKFCVKIALIDVPNVMINYERGC